MVKKDTKDFCFLEELDSNSTRKNYAVIEKETRIPYWVEVRESGVVTLPNAEGLVFSTQNDIELASVISNISETFLKIIAKVLNLSLVIDENDIDYILKTDNRLKKYRFIREAGNCSKDLIEQPDIDLFVLKKEDNTPEKFIIDSNLNFSI